MGMGAKLTPWKEALPLSPDPEAAPGAPTELESDLSLFALIAKELLLTLTNSGGNGFGTAVFTELSRFRLAIPRATLSGLSNFDTGDALTLGLLE